jgi:hypothetical protein
MRKTVAVAGAVVGGTVLAAGCSNDFMTVTAYGIACDPERECVVHVHDAGKDTGKAHDADHAVEASSDAPSEATLEEGASPEAGSPEGGSPEASDGAPSDTGPG